ncbi:MAG: hypothetical protein U0R24_03025 [Solirubrobacterales bacterium]
MAGLGTAQAQAATYCAELPTDTSCDQNFTGTTTAIQAAVDAADTHPGADTVKVGPGNFVMPSPVYLSNFGDGSRLTLVGSGDATVLSGSDPTSPDINFSGGQGSSISDLTILIPDDASNAGKTGLVVSGDATADHLHVSFATGTTGTKTTGVQLRDEATLSNSTVRLYNSNVNNAVTTLGSANTVRNSTLTAYRDVHKLNTSGTTEVERSALVVIGAGAVNTGGTLNIRDSVIVTPFGGGYGVYLSSTGASADTLIEGTTMVGAPGTGGGTSVGIVATASAGAPTPANTHLRLNSSVIYGYDYAIAHQRYFPADTLNIDVDSSAYDPALVGAGGAETTTFDVKDLVDLDNVDPKFLDPGNGDYSLAPGSPLIDGGQAAAPPTGSKDWQGNPRACDGNDDGAIRRDIGAYELRTDPNDDCVAPETTITAGPGATATFPYSLSVGSDDGSATWRCSFDGAAKSTCGPLVNAPDLGLGPRTFSVQAVDQYGNVDQTPATRQYTVVGGGEPGDTTPPEITKLKAPKTTKKKRAKVTFSADEAGAEFTCQLNKSKPKSCKSPWKTPKLKRGKNTIQVWATDKAGNRSAAVRRTITLR